MRHGAISISWMIMIFTLALMGCTPDPDSVVDEWIDNRPPQPDMAVEEPCTLAVDASGEYMLAIDTTLSPGTPLLFFVNVAIDMEAEPKTIEMVVRPISVEKMLIDEPLTPAEVELSEDGLFELPFGEVDVTGAANPVSGSDIKANLTLVGQVRSTEVICGSLTGELIFPSQFNLEGSTIGMIKYEGDGTDFSGIMPMLKCPACPGEEAENADSGMMDAGVTDAGSEDGDSGE